MLTSIFTSFLIFFCGRNRTYFFKITHLNVCPYILHKKYCDQQHNIKLAKRRKSQLDRIAVSQRQLKFFQGISRRDFGGRNIIRNYTEPVMPISDSNKSWICFLFWKINVLTIWLKVLSTTRTYISEFYSYNKLFMRFYQLNY